MVVITQSRDAEIKTRIREVIESRGGNASKVAKSMDLSPAYFSTVLSQLDKGISSTILKSLANIGVDINWLFTGDGKMNTLDEDGESLLSWKKKAIVAETRVDFLEQKLDRMAFLVEHLDSLIIQLHENKDVNGKGNS